MSPPPADTDSKTPAPCAKRPAASVLEAEAQRVDEARNRFKANGHAPKGKRSRTGDERMFAPLDAIPVRLSGEIAATVDLNEDAIAIVFASAHLGRLLYDAKRGKWFCWEGTHWKPDDGARVTREMIRRTVRQMCRGEPRWLTARMIDAVEKLSRTDARTCPRGAFDAEPLLIGTPAGVVDLRDGTMRAACPDDLMTRLTGTMPAQGAPCPRWLAFLGACIHGFGPDGEPRAAPPDDEMVTFLQRMCGYFLTGSTRHEFVFLLFGGGANGKSTFLRVLREIISEYFVSVNPRTINTRPEWRISKARASPPVANCRITGRGIRSASRTLVAEKKCLRAICAKTFTTFSPCASCCLWATIVPGFGRLTRPKSAAFE